MPGEDFDEDSADKDYSPPVNKADEVLKNLRLDHLNPEGKDHVLEIVREFHDNFYLPGEPLTPTDLVQPGSEFTLCDRLLRYSNLKVRKTVFFAIFEII